MKNLTTSKHSTVLDTDTKKNNTKNTRWFRISAEKTALPEFDQLLNHYWGGSERRITRLTIRIIAVNSLALVMLLLGIFYLGQYQSNLIEAKLETFKTKVDLVSVALSEGAIENQQKSLLTTSKTSKTKIQLSYKKAQSMIKRFSLTMNQHILLFDDNGELIIDSKKLEKPNDNVNIAAFNLEEKTLNSIQILKKMAHSIIKLIPDQRILPTYQPINSTQANDYPDAARAIKGEESVSAWYSEDDNIFLTASTPLIYKGQLLGVILLTKDGKDIKKDISEVWFNVLITFLITSVFTILLSIYLSGTIAHPLKKLARSVEGVRKGKLNYTDIPDMSSRHDEIGELSIALRLMTEALWDRMDSIEGFAADVAHELKNPLTSLRSAVETVSIVKKKSDHKKLIDIILHDVERMDRLISDISNASRLDAELSREELNKIDLKQLLNKLLNVYKTPLERKKTSNEKWGNNVTINKISLLLSSNTDNEINVWGLEGRLEQVFQNLISNALSFAPENSSVKIKVIEKSSHITIIVEDEGTGIPKNDLNNIFEKFYSQRPKHEDYGKHSGLGLSICKQIITALGGNIFAENIKDNADNITGARFTVILNKA